MNPPMSHRRMSQTEAQRGQSLRLRHTRLRFRTGCSRLPVPRAIRSVPLRIFGKRDRRMSPMPLRLEDAVDLVIHFIDLFVDVIEG